MTLNNGLSKDVSRSRSARLHQSEHSVGPPDVLEPMEGRVTTLYDDKCCLHFITQNHFSIINTYSVPDLLLKHWLMVMEMDHHLFHLLTQFIRDLC